MTSEERNALMEVRNALRNIRDRLLVVQQVAEGCEYCGCANLICDADGLIEGTIEALTDILWTDFN